MDSHGDWISSSFYMDNLPDWLINFQNQKPSSEYMPSKWELENYFSHDLDSLAEQKGFGIIKSTPFGNTILTDLALKIFKNEKLGKNKSTDFISISYSSTDYIGHQYGPHSKEIYDTYIKLDKEIAKLLTYLNYNIGKENVVIFLTADHGVSSEPHKLLDFNIPGGYFHKNEVVDKLTTHLRKYFNWPSDDFKAKEFIANFSNNQLFLNHDFISENLGNDKSDLVAEVCAKFLLKQEV